MTSRSIDALQRTLADTVFAYAADRKKAAGRALGTLVEMVTFCTLRTWGFLDHMVVERKLPEFANPDIVHNVEFTLHHVRSRCRVYMTPLSLPLTAAKVKREVPSLARDSVKAVQILSRNSLKRNAALLLERTDGPVVANIEGLDQQGCTLLVCELARGPFAMFECKRVGVEEGMRKGPQTIEKAKQGAYVARTVSSLQKIRLRDGQFRGVIENADGTFLSGPYLDILRDIVNSPVSAEIPSGVILTVGVVSNHGNWFTSGDLNKELQVLAQSYDWLVFLTDDGLAQFVDDLLLSPSQSLRPASRAFLESYSGKPGTNRFTKVRVDVEADEALRSYFVENKRNIDSWFNVISPRKRKLGGLRSDLHKLARRAD